jgi:hypothetical protein
MVLKSLTQRSECVVAKSRRLRVITKCLVCYSMRLGVPFIAPSQLRVVGDPIGRQFLPSVGWRTGQSGAPPDINSSYLVPDLLPYRAHSTVGPSVPLAHWTMSDAHRTVWCDQLTVGAGHASLADCTVDRWRGRLWLIGQSTVFFMRATSSSPGQPGHRTLSGAHRTVRCTTGWCWFG